MDIRSREFRRSLTRSTMSREMYKKAVLQAKEHILAGDIYQIVLTQRFERRTFAHPFEVYRSVRIVNPSPYMAYLQVCWLLTLQLLLDITCSFLLEIYKEVALIRTLGITKFMVLTAAIVLFFPMF